MSSQLVPLEQRFTLSLDEAAALCGISKSSLYGLMRDGLLAYTKPSKRRFILRKDLEDYLLRSRRLDSAPATV